METLILAEYIQTDKQTGRQTDKQNEFFQRELQLLLNECIVQFTFSFRRIFGDLTF